ncbi:helix-hairpin-helix domain-containing protein [Algoriphagus halophilus]|uniref:ComEA family DNA-binding protein n=1 Tax=Algoriphagus halophilus TaxID=226505 RepID=UPI00358FF216
MVERLFPVQDEDMDYESIYEVLFQLYSNPININKASAETLQASYLLSPNQITSILSYREKFGPFLSLYELQAVPNLDLNTISQILPFITMGETESNFSKTLLKEFLRKNKPTFCFGTEGFGNRDEVSSQ